ncbi:MAG: glycoside hydrolase family protein [Clostridia bacterium]|nr:glycoside hydrolase family protein [Clostridia bacterium]
MKKRILSAILSLAIIFGIVPAFSVLAEEKGYVKRSISELGVNFIEAYEGYFQYAYWDYSQYTIGYGTRCEKDEYPAGISEPAAHALLKKVLPNYESPLNTFLKKYDIFITQNQFDALVSLTYNMGGSIWSDSRDTTIARYLKQGKTDYKNISYALGLWVNAGGVKLPGLVERRKAETELFFTEDFSFDKEVYMVNSSVNLRTGPGTSYSYVSALKKGQPVVVTEKRYIGKRVWGKTVVNDKTCWVCLDYAKYANDQSTSSDLISTCLYKTENVDGGIKLSWKKVNGATGYKVYKKAPNKSAYLLIKKTTKQTTVSYTDTDVSQGQYKYYVIAYNGEKEAKRSSICQIDYVKAPKIKSFSKLDNGFKLTWAKHTEASSYYVMRRSADDDYFVKIAETNSDTLNYSDTSAVGGVTYYYSVKAVTSKGISGAPEAKSGVYLATPVFESAKTAEKSITLNWSKCYGVKGYYLYRKAEGESSKKLIKTIEDKNATSYTDTNVSKGKTYIYYLKSYNDTINSKQSAAFTVKIYIPPVLSSATSTNNGVVLKWKAAADAKGYNVYRREKSEKDFSKIANVSATSYTDKTALAGMQYYYRITTVSANNSESYRSNYKTCKHFISTKITESEVVKTGIKIKWNKVANAKSYSVYKYASKKYVLLKTVTGTFYTDTTVGTAASRSYAIVVNYNKVSSDYSSNFKAYNLAKPVLKVKSVANGLLLSWNSVKNAKGIIIYRKGPDDKKFVLYTTQPTYTKNTFENSTALKGKKYSYKIKVIRGNCKSQTSNTVTKTRK